MKPPDRKFPMGVIRLGNDMDVYVTRRKIVQATSRAVPGPARFVLHSYTVCATFSFVKGIGHGCTLYKKAEAEVSCHVHFLPTHHAHGGGGNSESRGSTSQALPADY